MLSLFFCSSPSNMTVWATYNPPPAIFHHTALLRHPALLRHTGKKLRVLGNGPSGGFMYIILLGSGYDGGIERKEKQERLTNLLG
jgi:hypothetical protein